VRHCLCSGRCSHRPKAATALKCPRREAAPRKTVIHGIPATFQPMTGKLGLSLVSRLSSPSACYLTSPSSMPTIAHGRRPCHDSAGVAGRRTETKTASATNAALPSSDCWSPTVPDSPAPPPPPAPVVAAPPPVAPPRPEAPPPARPPVSAQPPVSKTKKGGGKTLLLILLGLLVACCLLTAIAAGIFWWKKPAFLSGGFVDQARQKEAVVLLRTIGASLEAYRAVKGFYPPVNVGESTDFGIGDISAAKLHLSQNSSPRFRRWTLGETPSSMEARWTGTPAP